MGKLVKAAIGVALVVVGVVVPGAQFLIAPGISMTLGALLSPSAPKSPRQNKATGTRLTKTIDPEAFRKIVFGKTCGGADIRYWEVWGTDSNNYDEVIAVAGHEINSFQGFWLEEVQVSFDGSGNATTSPYSGHLTRLTNNGHVGNAALAAGAGVKWTSASKFRGSAHYVMRWLYDQTALPQGIPTRYTCEVEGALVYDPRKDSTRGGSGAHRADDQTTWQYSPTDSNGVPIGRNNALQVLWYLIGWRVLDTSANQVLVAGRGVDLNDIDFASFIAAANACETQGYYTDMILSTGDSHQTNEDIITAGGIMGCLIDPGGLWNYTVNKNDSGVVDVTLTDDDVVDTGTVEWNPYRPLSEQFNRVVGSFIDPSSLYQSKPYPQVIDTGYETADGFKKRKTINYQGVQDSALAQKLGRLILNQGRWQGEFTAKFTFKALKTQLYGVVFLTLSQYGWTNKAFRVLTMTVSGDGVEMRLGEIDSSVWTAGTINSGNPGGSGGNGSGNNVNITGVHIVPGSVDTVLYADYTGALKSGELARGANSLKLYDNGVVVTSGIAWSYTVVTGSLNGNTSASGSIAISGSGVATLSLTALGSAGATIQVKAIYLGMRRTLNLQYSIVKDAAPTGTSTSSGGTTASDSTINSTSSATYGSAQSNILQAKAGSAGRVDLYAPLSFTLSANGTNGAFGKWQWRIVGGTFADVTTEIASTVSAFRGPDGDGYTESDPGSIGVTMAKTGLTNGTTYEFQLLLRNASGSLSHFYTGTASAVGS